jgi:hypothetical protein
MDNPLLFLLLGFGMGITLSLSIVFKNKTNNDQPEDSLTALRHNATKAGLYDPEERRRDASVPAPLEMPEKPKRGRPKKIPVLEPQREPLVFTCARRNAKLN